MDTLSRLVFLGCLVALIVFYWIDVRPTLGSAKAGDYQLTMSNRGDVYLLDSLNGTIYTLRSVEGKSHVVVMSLPEQKMVVTDMKLLK